MLLPIISINKEDTEAILWKREQKIIMSIQVFHLKIEIPGLFNDEEKELSSKLI